MKTFTIEQIARSERLVKKFQPEDSYILSYREFIAYFAGLEGITAHNLVIGAHFAYGWMPTILELKKTAEFIPSAVTILNEAKRGREITEEDLQVLRDTINNSLVGASKLLHFVNPNSYAIWDSRVFKYINGQPAYNYQMQNTQNYLGYLANCKEITETNEFKPVHASMNAKLGYAVSPFRAVELIMFMNSINKQ
ncbi:MAG: hypothetical protein ACKVRN_08740 [Pyrinomonadaceae bacterium]